MFQFLNLSAWLNSVLFLFVMLMLILSASLFGVVELGALFSDLNLVKASGSLAQFFSISFLLGIALISILVFAWGRYYMFGSTSLSFFFYTLFSFVLSMMLLVFSDSFLSVFLGWEGLGVTSFMLIIFYQNWMSMKGGLLTLLTNRLGDGLLMLSLSYWVMNFSVLGLMRSASILAFLFFLSTTFTKSAQVPFTSWLPAAMAAPTPVSALVHSSTLVTAGIWLLIRFGQQLVTFSILSIFFGLSTLITASLSALAETDGKKVVALSTLSQLGLMYLSLSLGGAVICLFHLLMHAFAKANLFLMVGNFIHSSFSQQDSRQSSSGEQSASAYLMMVVSLLSLSGMVFFSGFFSKDLILILQYPMLNSVISYGIILSVVSLTFSYCFKLILTLLSNSKSGPVKEKLMSKATLLPSILLTVLSILLGWSFVFNSGAPLLWKQSMSGFYWVALLLVFLILLSSSKKSSIMIYLFYIQIKLIDLFNSFSLISGKKSSMKSTSSMLEPMYLFSSFFLTKLSNLTFTRIVLILLLSMVIIFNC